MLHPPWSRKQELKADGKHRLKVFPCPARAIINTFEAFKTAGGSPEELVDMLNNHFPPGWQKITVSNLSEPKNYYSFEFQLYIACFTKFLLKDPFFRYCIDEQTQLPDYHGPIEKGLLDFAPWIIDDGNNKSGYISIVNITVLFYYIEDEYLLPGYDGDQASLGRRLSEEAVCYLNCCTPDKFRMDRDFFNKEGVIVSFEYMCLVVNLLRALSNDEQFTSKAFYFGFRNYSTMAKAIFLKPEISLEDAFQEWQYRTNNLYNMEFRRGYRNFQIKVNLRKQLQTGMFGLYQANYVSGILFAVPSVHRAFVELSIKQKTSVKVSPAKGSQYSYWIKVGWKSLRILPSVWSITVFSGAVFLAAMYLSHLFLSPQLSAAVPGAIVSVLTFAIALLSLYWRNKFKSVRGRFNETQEVISKQLDSLKETTNELLAERDSLDRKVKERTAELKEALEQLKELDRSKTNFIAAVSHELRTPLTLLSVPLEGIKNGSYGESLSPDNPVFALIERNVKRLNVQISQLLEFSRLDIGAVSFKPVYIELVGCCRLIVAELESLAERKGLFIRLDNKTGKNEIVVSADARLLETLLVNLINNALKFTDSGGISIVLKEGTEHGKIVLRVEDTGIGFPLQQKDRLFQRFTQAEEHGARRREGAGLGLALVSEIAELHDWSFDAESEEGRGSAFIITMPVEDVSSIDEAGGALQIACGQGCYDMAETGLFSSEEAPNGEYHKDRDTVLILEDNPDMGTVLLDLLKPDYNLKWFKNGADALSWLEGLPQLSLIICDVMMPGMSGFSFREELLKHKPYGDLPFIYLTALADPVEKTAGLESGAVDYIRKPFTASELVLKVRNLIESHKAIYLQAVKDQSSRDRLNRMISETGSGKQRPDWPSLGITEAEKRIIELARLGMQDKEIAAVIGISVRTVSSHLSHLYQKTETQNRVELINMLYK